MNIQNDNSAEANRFRPVAQRFCSLVDSAGTLERTEFLVQVYRMLPELIGEAMRLPTVVLSDDEDEDQETSMCQFQAETNWKHEDWSQLYNALREKLGDGDLYWHVFDPIKENEAIRGSLADDIAGVYGDLKEGLNLKESEKVPPRDIIFEWRFGFYSHWGRHAINALRTIHCLLEDTLS